MKERTNKEWAEEMYASDHDEGEGVVEPIKEDLPENDPRRQRAEKLFVDRVQAWKDANSYVAKRLQAVMQMEEFIELLEFLFLPTDKKNDAKENAVHSDIPDDLSTIVNLLNQDYAGKEQIENALQHGNTLNVSYINVHQASELLVRLNDAGPKETITPEQLEAMNDRYFMTALVDGKMVARVVEKDTFERVSAMDESQRLNEFRRVFGVSESQSRLVPISENLKLNSTNPSANLGIGEVRYSENNGISEHHDNGMRAGESASSRFEQIMQAQENQELTVRTGIRI